MSTTTQVIKRKWHPLIDPRHFMDNGKLMSDEEILRVKSLLKNERGTKFRRIYQRRTDFEHYDPKNPREGLKLRSEYQKMVDAEKQFGKSSEEYKKVVQDLALERINIKPKNKLLEEMNKPNSKSKEAIKRKYEAYFDQKKLQKALEAKEYLEEVRKIELELQLKLIWSFDIGDEGLVVLPYEGKERAIGFGRYGLVKFAQELGNIEDLTPGKGKLVILKRIIAPSLQKTTITKEISPEIKATEPKENKPEVKPSATKNAASETKNDATPDTKPTSTEISASKLMKLHLDQFVRSFAGKKYLIQEFGGDDLLFQSILDPKEADDAYEKRKAPWVKARDFIDSMDERLCIAKSVFQRMKEMHLLGILHRDIKSQNITYNRETGEITFVDFGLACTLEEGLHAIEVLGTPYAIPPEIYYAKTLYKSNPVYTPSSDVYSAGTVLQDLFGFEGVQSLKPPEYYPYPKSDSANCINGLDKIYPHDDNRNALLESTFPEIKAGKEEVLNKMQQVILDMMHADPDPNTRKITTDDEAIRRLTSIQNEYRKTLAEIAATQLHQFITIQTNIKVEAILDKGMIEKLVQCARLEKKLQNGLVDGKELTQEEDDNQEDYLNLKSKGKKIIDMLMQEIPKEVLEREIANLKEFLKAQQEAEKKRQAEKQAEPPPQERNPPKGP